MSRDFNTSHLEIQNAPARLPTGNGSAVWTVAGWIKPDTVSGDQALLNRYPLVSAGNWGALVRLTGATMQLFVLNTAAVGQTANAPGTVVTGVWQHFAAGVRIPNNSAQIMAALNGSVTTTNISNGQIDSRVAANWRFGRTATDASSYDGIVAYLGMWSAALTDTEIASLAGGVSPLMIRPGSLVGFWPAWEQDNFTGTPSAYSTEVLADSPWAYWRLDETSGTNADDSSTNNRDGTYNGSPSLNQSGAITTDPSSPAVDFDATDDYVRSNAIFNSSTATLECWYEYSGTPPGSNVMVCGCANGDGNATHDKVIYINNAGQPFAYAFDGAGKTTSFGRALTTGWHHLVLTVGGGVLRLYVDGVLYSYVAASSSFTGYSVNNVFVAASTLNHGRLAGKRDEFAIYTSSLSADRIGQHYAAGLGVQNPAVSIHDISGGGAATTFHPIGTTPGTTQPPVAPILAG